MDNELQTAQHMTKSTEHTTDQLPPTSLIICSRNRQDMLRDTIQSVLQGDELPAEIVIIDQSDSPDEVLRQQMTGQDSNVRYIWSRTRGLSRANNLGIATARHDILVFTHDDVFVERDWFSAMIQALVEAGSEAVVTSGVLLSNEGREDGFQLTKKVEEQEEVYEGRLGKDVLPGLSIGLHRSAFTEVGFMDERMGPGTPFPAAEDNDLGFRLLESGYHILYLPEAVLYHRAWRTESDYLPLRWAYGVGQGGFYAKHLSFRDRYMLRRMLWDVWRHGRRIPGRILHRDRRGLYSDSIYVSALLYGTFRWLLTHQKAE
jgi:GT2 family glycosyltransferase